jgi:hypothetical protein
MSTEENDIRDQIAEEIEKDFTYDGYQVVRRELFAHLRESAVVIRADSITFNTACIDGLEDAIYIQILINPTTKKMVVRKCDENDKDALRWCMQKPDKRRSRKVISKIFSAKIFEMMGWDTECRYKMLGHKISFEDEQIYVFDLIEPEIFLNTKKGRKVTDENPLTSEEIEKIKENRAAAKVPYYPEKWKDSFGLPVEDHKVALDIDIIDGYAALVINTKSREKSAHM